MATPHLSSYIAPVLDIVVSTSAGIAFDGIAKQLIPSDLKALPAFGIRIGVAVVGGLIANKIAKVVVENVESVVETVYPQADSEDVASDTPQEEN